MQVLNISGIHGKIAMQKDVFSHEYQTLLYNVGRNAYYQIGWNDTDNIENASNVYMHSSLSVDDINSIGLVNELQQTSIFDLVKNLKLQTCVINLSRPGETYFHHTHADNTKVILYYPNINWNREWGGETLFYSSTSKELIFANEYVPNTLLYFDGSIPHTIRAPTYTAPEYRFTISTFWK